MTDIKANFFGMRNRRFESAIFFDRMNDIQFNQFKEGKKPEFLSG